MKHLLLPIGLIGAIAAFAQPSLRSTDPVVNGASYASAIAPGSVFVVFGTNLAGDAIQQAASLPLQTSLGGVSIRFVPVAGGSGIDALMVYTTRNQIAGLLPSSAAPGDYNVTVTYSGQTSAPGRAKVAAQSFGIVSADSSGGGQAQAQAYRTATEWDLNRFAKGTLGPYTTAPSNPGQVLVFWGTGIGADSQSDLTGGTTGDRTASASIRVQVGSKVITPVYAGRASGLPGTDQINFTLPADVERGCNIPAAVSVGSSRSNTVYLAITPAGQDVCSHPFMNTAQLQRLSSGGTLTMGRFGLTKQTISISIQGINLDSTTEGLNGSFARYGVGNVGEFSNTLTPPVGTCTVTRVTASQDDLTYGRQPAVALDAGAQLTLNGPGASNVAVPRGQGNFYLKELVAPGGGLPGIPGIPGGSGGASAIAAGTYNLTGPGGADIGAFNTSVTVPTPLDWTNKNSISNIDRSQNLNVTWTGGGSNVVTISGISGTLAGGTQQKPVYDAAVFFCYQNASAGSFSVPSAVLSQLPESVGDILTGGTVGLLGVEVEGPPNGGPFTAPLTAGGNIDFGFYTFSLGVSKTVTWR